MEMASGLLAMLPAEFASVMPAWLERLDGANLVIGAVTLIVGLLGMAYLVLALMVTPQPQLAESFEPSPYPGVDRFVVPLFLPIGVALAIAAIIFLTSQILLAVPESLATLIALCIALFILIVCAVVATAPRVPRGLVYTIVGIPVLALIVAGSAAGMYRQGEAEKAAEARANAPQTALSEVTTDNKFSQTTLNIPAGQAITLTQNNKGQAIHNWHVLNVKDSDGKDVTTPLTQPGQTANTTFTLATAGSYKFQCDVHPTEMVGTLNVH
jgi:plastocyanin